MPLTQRLAMASSRRPWRTVVAWGLVVVLAVAAIVMLLGSAITPRGGLTTEPDSVKGLELVNDRFPDRDAVSELVVVVADSGNVDDPLVREVVTSLREEIATAEAVRSVGDPFAAEAVGLVSQDGNAVLVATLNRGMNERAQARSAAFCLRDGILL